MWHTQRDGTRSTVTRPRPACYPTRDARSGRVTLKHAISPAHMSLLLPVTEETGIGARKKRSRDEGPDAGEVRSFG